MAARQQRERRTAAYQHGLAAEHAAARMLLDRGYEILSQRYRSPAGEIDLVASDGQHLAFVEVKARRTLDDAAWSITPRQQQRIAAAADHWLQTYPDHQHQDMSFDAVLVAPRRRPHYISDAFRI